MSRLLDALVYGAVGAFVVIVAFVGYAWLTMQPGDPADDPCLPARMRAIAEVIAEADRVYARECGVRIVNGHCRGIETTTTFDTTTTSVTSSTLVDDEEYLHGS